MSRNQNSLEGGSQIIESDKQVSYLQGNVLHRPTEHMVWLEEPPGSDQQQAVLWDPEHAGYLWSQWTGPAALLHDCQGTSGNYHDRIIPWNILKEFIIFVAGPKYIFYNLCHQNFLMMLQKTILKDKAVVDVFRILLAAVNPVQGIVGRYPPIKNEQPAIFYH